MTRRSTARLLASLLCAWLALSWSTPAGAEALGSTAATELRVMRQSASVGPEGVFELDVRIAGAPADSTISTGLFGRVTDRSEFGPATLGAGVGDRIYQREVPAADTEPSSGGERTLAVRFNLCSQFCGSEDILLSNDGVYPIDVRLLDTDGEELARVITFIVRLPDEPWTGVPLRAALLLKVHAPPAMAPDGTSKIDPRALERIDLVSQALLAHPDVPVTVAPTPETVASLVADQTDLFERLKIALGPERRQVIAGFYVDLPLSSWVDAGMNDEIGLQRERGTDVLQDLVTDPSVRTWLADSTLTVDAAARLPQIGVGQIIVDPDGLTPLDPPLDSGANALTRRFELDTGSAGGLRAVQIDPNLRAAFGRPNDVLAAHLLLAELAVVAYEAPDDQRGVLITPPSNWEPSATFLDLLLNGLATIDPLIQATTVDDLFAGIPAESEGSGPADVDEDALRRRVDPRPSPPLGSYPSRLADSRGLLGSYRSFIGPDSRRVDPFDERLLVSAASELSTERRLEFVSEVNADVNRSFKQLEVPTQQTVTLTSAFGKLPVTIRNPLDYEVTVVVSLTSSQRLEFTNGGTRSVTLEAGETRSLEFAVRARATGDTPVQVVVLTPDGVHQIEASRYNVRSTAVSGVGVLLTVGAAAFLALWWIRHVRLVRRQRRERLLEAADGGGVDTGVPSSVE